MNITDYESLLKAALQQVEPQRLLFVFLKASLSKDYNEQEKSDFHAGQGGTLQAVMCVDKAAEELGSFSDLVKESEKTGQDWHIVLVAGLSGINNVAPGSAEVDRSLKMMMKTVQNGGDLSRFMAFNRGGEPVQFS
ncbi:MAG: ribonucleotide reductase subunit alpha [Gammaproteobacteria bacterium]|nr:ribonucleotide reductase subunit alpha [Gammaproteobacteria bacterium]